MRKAGARRHRLPPLPSRTSSAAAVFHRAGQLSIYGCSLHESLSRGSLMSKCHQATAEPNRGAGALKRGRVHWGAEPHIVRDPKSTAERRDISRAEEAVLRGIRGA